MTRTAALLFFMSCLFSVHCALADSRSLYGSSLKWIDIDSSSDQMVVLWQDRSRWILAWYSVASIKSLESPIYTEALEGDFFGSPNQGFLRTISVLPEKHSILVVEGKLAHPKEGYELGKVTISNVQFRAGKRITSTLWEGFVGSDTQSFTDCMMCWPSKQWILRERGPSPVYGLLNVDGYKIIHSNLANSFNILKWLSRSKRMLGFQSAKTKNKDQTYLFESKLGDSSFTKLVDIPQYDSYANFPRITYTSPNEQRVIFTDLNTSGNVVCGKVSIEDRQLIMLTSKESGFQKAFVFQSGSELSEPMVIFEKNKKTFLKPLRSLIPEAF